MKRQMPRPQLSAGSIGAGFAWPAIGIFLIALLVRLLHTWQIRRSPFFAELLGDSRGYDTWARQIAGGDWLGHDVFYQAPLYPYFLGTIYAAAGRDLLIVRVCQAVLGSAACVLLGLTAARLFSRTAGLIAGLALALYAPAIFFDGILQKTVLDVFFVCLALWLMSGIITKQYGVSGFSRTAPQYGVSGFSRTELLLGITMGFLALTRENAMVFVVVIVSWILVGQKPDPARVRMTRAAMFLLGLAVVLTPVAVRNSLVGGGFYVTTAQFGPNFYLGNNPTADGTAQSLRAGRGSAEYERQDATELAEQALGRRLTPGEVSQYWTNRALGYVTSQPGAWLKLMTRKFLLLWNATEMLDTESQESYAEWSVPLRIGGRIGHFGVLVPLALVGIVLTWPDRRRLWVLYAMMAAYAASVLLFFVYARYRFPLVPFLILFAAPAIVAVIDFATGRQRRDLHQHFSTGAGAPPPARSYADASPRIRSSSARHGRRRLRVPVVSASPVISLTIVVTVLTGIAIFTNWPVLSPALMRAITEHNLGAALQTDGRVDEAIAHYRRALAFKPDHAPALNNLGTALAAKGDADGAIDSYEQALAVEPGYSSAHFNLANALLQRGNADQAADHFRLALQSAPGSADVHNNLGIALSDEGRIEEAIVEFRRALEFDPASAKTHRNLGGALASAGRVAEGIDELKRAVSLDPRDGPTRYDLATVLVEADRLPEAIDEFHAALELMPQSLEVLNNLGIALARIGRLDEAIAIFERALTLQADFAPAQRNLAAARQQRQQQKSAPPRR